ncbi:MAG: hypothetical protein ACPGWR_03670 [Ardenticatenaceae bacterium]
MTTPPVIKESYPNQRPYVRRDLVYTPNPNDPFSSCIIKNPKTRRYFRVSKQVALVMQAMDGTRTIADIRAKFTLSSQSIQSLMTILSNLKLIEHIVDDDLSQKSLNNSQKRKEDTGFNILFFKKELIEPDKWIERIYNSFRLKYIFDPYCGIGLCIIYILAYLVYRSNTPVMKLALIELADPKWIVVGWAVWLVDAILHELAHGFACKHFGGTVYSIGIGIYYFRPIFYCDVTDAWMFRRSQRIITHSAGIFMSLFLGSFAVFVIGFFGERSPNISAIAMLFFGISGVRSLANLNPLLKLDGYFLLADGLGIENLRHKAFSYLFMVLRSIPYRLGIVKKSNFIKNNYDFKKWLPMLLYALLSFAYIIAIFSFIGYQVGELLASYIGKLGWLFSLSLVVILLGVLLRKRWEAYKNPSTTRII